MSLTRTEARRLIGDRLGLMTLLIATGGSDSTHLEDVVRLGEWGNDALQVVRRTLYFSGGTSANLGHEARATAFDSATRTLTFAPPADATVAEGDEVEMWGLAQQVSISAIHRLLNQAIRSVDRLAVTEAYTTPAIFNPLVPELPIPDDWAYFGGAEYTTANGLIRQVPTSHLLLRPGRRTVELRKISASRARMRPVTFYGYARAQILTTENSVTNVEPDWLIESVISAVRLGGAQRATDPAAAERQSAFWDQNAKLYRQRNFVPMHGQIVALP